VGFSTQGSEPLSELTAGGCGRGAVTQAAGVASEKLVSEEMALWLKMLPSRLLGTSCRTVPRLCRFVLGTFGFDFALGLCVLPVL